VQSVLYQLAAPIRAATLDDAPVALPDVPRCDIKQDFLLAMQGQRGGNALASVSPKCDIKPDFLLAAQGERGMALLAAATDGVHGESGASLPSLT
jgi:hypothetical protein